MRACWDYSRWRAGPRRCCLQRVRPRIEPTQSYEKNQLGLSQMFLNSLRLTWCLALLADAAVLLRSHALIQAPAETHLLRELAPCQSWLDLGWESENAGSPAERSSR